MTTGSTGPNQRSSSGRSMPDIMQMVQQQLARLNQNLQRQVQQVTSGYQQGFNASSGGPSGPAMGGMGISQAQFQAQQSSQQISQSAMPSPGGGSGSAGGGGLGSRIPGGMKSAYGLMGGHLGMGIMAASMILPAMMQGGASGRNQETQITELEKSAHRASSAIARLNLNLRMTAAATGTSAGGVISTASMYSAVGVEDSLGMAQNMAAQHAAYTGQMAMGTPNMGAMTGYAMLGMDPMAPMRNRPEAMQNMVIDHLRGMSPDQRGGHRTRGALMATGMSLDEIGAVLAQANLSQQDREYSTQLQGWVQRAANSPETDILTRRQQNISEINAYAQARAHNVEMTKSYLRASGRERPMMAQFQDQLTEQWQRAQIQFWLSMQPMLERLRSIFEDLIKPGGGLATFGDIVSYMADMFARSLTLAVGAVMMFAGTLGVTGNIAGTGGNVLSELSRGEFRGAWGAVQAGQSRHRIATGMISGGQELILQALTESGYNPSEIDRLMGMNGRPGAPYEQSQVIVQGVPVDELISRGYRRGEQTGRVLPGQGSTNSIYNTAQP